LVLVLPVVEAGQISENQNGCVRYRRVSSGVQRKCSRAVRSRSLLWKAGQEIHRVEGGRGLTVVAAPQLPSTGYSAWHRSRILEMESSVDVAEEGWSRRSDTDVSGLVTLLLHQHVSQPQISSTLQVSLDAGRHWTWLVASVYSRDYEIDTGPDRQSLQVSVRWTFTRKFDV